MSDADRERIAVLEAELAAAQRTIDVLIARVERSGTPSPSQTELFDAAARMGHVLEERTREVADARAEFRALRANLDQIVRQRTRALAEMETQLRAKKSAPAGIVSGVSLSKSSDSITSCPCTIPRSLRQNAKIVLPRTPMECILPLTAAMAHLLRDRSNIRPSA